MRSYRPGPLFSSLPTSHPRTPRWAASAPVPLRAAAQRPERARSVTAQRCQRGVASAAASRQQPSPCRTPAPAGPATQRLHCDDAACSPARTVVCKGFRAHRLRPLELLRDGQRAGRAEHGRRVVRPRSDAAVACGFARGEPLAHDGVDLVVVAAVLVRQPLRDHRLRDAGLRSDCRLRQPVDCHVIAHFRHQNRIRRRVPGGRPQGRGRQHRARGSRLVLVCGEQAFGFGLFSEETKRWTLPGT